MSASINIYMKTFIIKFHKKVPSKHKVDDDKEMYVECKCKNVAQTSISKVWKNTFDVVYNKQRTKLDLTLHTK
jgi:hypothetical protein